MKNVKKLNLEEIKVESFVTTLTALDSAEQEAIKGGMHDALGTTAVRVFC